MPGKCSIRELVTFPLQLLSEASMLRSLCLFASNLEPNFQGPFRSLMSLRLDVVPLVDVQSILSSCLKLESLILTYCGLPSKLFSGGPELELKSLTILSCFGVEKIALCAENLTTFETVSSDTIKFCPSHVPKVQQGYFRTNYPGEVAKDMPQLESLYLQAVISKILPASLPTFSNIRQLYLLMESVFMFDVQQVCGFIIACPLLQRFHLENDISLILYLLKSVVALEQMLIRRDCRYYIGGRRRDEEKKPPFGKKELETIHQQLQGQAVSSTARVIIW